MKFTESHEWVEVEGSVGTIGVTDYAQKELGVIVYVELPEVGKTVKIGDDAAVLESTKAAADIYTPISGKIVEVNEALNNNPELINDSPEKEGWLFKIEINNLAELDNLLDADKYQTTIQ